MTQVLAGADSLQNVGSSCDAVYLRGFDTNRAEYHARMTVDNFLNVSVAMALTSEVLVTVHVHCTTSVSDFKHLIQKHLPTQIGAFRMTLMLGPQVLAEGDALADAGVVDGTTLLMVVGPSYKLLVVNDGGLELWNDGGALERTFLDFGDECHFATFSPDSTLVVACRTLSSFQLWRADSEEWDEEDPEEDSIWFAGHSDIVNSVAFSPDGTTLLTASVDGTVKQWSVSSGECLRTLQHEHDQPGWHNLTAVFSPCGGQALSTTPGSIVLWSLECGRRVWDYPHGCPEYTGRPASFSPCGKMLFAVGRSGDAVQIWRVCSCSRFRRLEGHSDYINDVAFSPDSSQVVTACDDHTARVWSLGRKKKFIEFWHPAQVDSANFSPDGVQIVTASANKAWLWDLFSLTLLRRFGELHISTAIFTPDGLGVVTSGRLGAAAWSAACGEGRWDMPSRFWTKVVVSPSQQAGLSLVRG